MLTFAPSDRRVNIPLSRRHCPFQPFPVEPAESTVATATSAPRVAAELQVLRPRLPRRNTQAQHSPIELRWYIAQQRPTERRCAGNRVPVNLETAGEARSRRDDLCPRIAQPVGLESLIEPIRSVLTSQSAALAPIRQAPELALTYSDSISPRLRKTPAGNMLTSHEPPEQQVVIELFHQQPLASHRVQHLQQQRPQQLLRRD